MAFSTNDSLYDMIVIETPIRVFEIIEKVSFNIAIEASYVYIFSGQKFFNDKNWWKMSKLKNSNGIFWVIFKHCERILHKQQ